MNLNLKYELTSYVSPMLVSYSIFNEMDFPPKLFLP